MSTRQTREQRVVEQMIRLYCRHKEGHATLCPTCRRCPIHCYRPAMRERIRCIMRWAGPRMLLYHPLAALRHLWDERPRRR